MHRSIHCLLVLVFSINLHANPSGGTVVAGSAAISGGTGLTVINQGSDRVIINWSDFSIGNGELTKFIQPTSTSAALNRVISGNPSQILGALQANGQVWVINANGIMIGAGATIHTQGFLASTLDIQDSDFLTGGPVTFMGTSTASVSNQGAIQAIGGDVILMARRVENSGTIQAGQGVAALTSGSQIVYSPNASDRITVISGTTVGSVPQGINQSGLIQAAQAELKAVNGNPYALAIKNSGTIRATKLVNQGGRILIVTDGSVQNTGTLDVSASGTGARGGAIHVQAGGLIDHSGQMLAQGTAQGGSIHLQSADITTETNSVLDASSSQGTGGSIALRVSDEWVGTAGSIINAAGAQQGGKISITMENNEADALFSSTLDASSSGGQGGEIELAGGTLLLANPLLVASGATGGGQIKLGGDSGGAEILNTPNSQTVYVGSGTRIQADATSNGNGGQVVLWSDGTMEFDGAITARGGAEGGNGGQVEVSGRTGYTFTGTVDTSAPNGMTGGLLLDPHNLTIDSTATSVTSVLMNTLSAQAIAYNSDGAGSDQFGNAVAINGNYQLIGAPNRNANQGAAFLFNNGQIAVEYTDPGVTSGDNFGDAVALSSANVLIGSGGQGSVYLYNLTSNTPTLTYTDPGASTIDSFGTTVDLSSTNALIGAYGTNGFRGVAYLYNLTSNTPTLTYTDPNAVNNDAFGVAVALSNTNALIGGAGVGGNNIGAAYLYNLTTNTPVVTYTDPGATNHDNFGNKVALSSTNALIGAFQKNSTQGEAFLYDLTTNSPLVIYTDPGNTANDYYGDAVALSSTNALIGAFQENGNQGAAFLYNLTSNTPLVSYIDPSATSGDNFGHAVALSTSNALIGAYGVNNQAGAVYLYNLTSNSVLNTLTTTVAPLNDAASGDNFGVAVAINGNYELIGATGNQGAAYLFNNGQILVKYTDPGATGGDLFGNAVALSGSNVLIGSNGFNTSEGIAYLYNLTSNTPVVTYTDPTAGSFDYYATSVALNNSYALIGDNDELGVYNSGNGNEGVAFLYNLTSNLPVLTYTDPGATVGDNFGYAVALSNSNALIGAPGASSPGAAYVYNLTINTPLVTYTDPGATVGDNFGYAVALSNSNALIGAIHVNSQGAAYVYNLTTNTPLVTYTDPGATVGDNFGYAVALNSSNALIGANEVNGQGAAYLYNLTTNAPLVTYTDPGATSGDEFGASVSLSSSNALIGAYGVNGQGATYLYNLTTNTPLTTFTAQSPYFPDTVTSDNFGSAVAINGNYELIGAPNKNSSQGAAYLFDIGQIAEKYSDPTANNGDSFGIAVGLSATNALVGAYGVNGNQGAAYLYTLSSNTPTLTYTDPGASGGDNFGYAVGLSSTNALVGAYGVNGNQGAAYLYTLSSNTPTLTYADPGASGGDNFGYSVGVSTTNALIGAYGVNGNQGAAYLYTLSSNTPTLTYADPGASGGDNFGYSVGVSTTNALIGAYGVNGNQGAAYLYTLSSNTPTLTYADPGASGGDNFGYSVGVSTSNALVGAYGTSSNQGAAYLYTLTNNAPAFTYTDPGTTNSDNFGYSVALSSTDVLIGADGATGNQGAAYLYSLGLTTSQLQYYGTPGSDQTISVNNVLGLLSTTNLQLQANNDLTLAVNSDITSTSSNNLILQAGRSILLNSNITTNGGALTLIANDNSVDGVVDANRDAGTAVITQTSGTTLNAGTGAVSITLNPGTGNTNTDSGQITLAAVKGSTITVANLGTTAGSGVTLNGQLTSTAAAAQSIKLEVANGHLANSFGSTALQTNAASSWLVELPTVTGNTFGGLVSGNPAFWNVAAGASVATSSNTYAFALQPTLMVTTAPLSKNYGVDDTVTVASDYSITGFQIAPGGEFTDNAANVVSGSLTSSGATATATASGGPYPITQGSLVAVNGYALSFTPADLTVNENPSPVSASSTAGSQTSIVTPVTLTTPNILNLVSKHISTMEFSLSNASLSTVNDQTINDLAASENTPESPSPQLLSAATAIHKAGPNHEVIVWANQIFDFTSGQVPPIGTAVTISLDLATSPSIKAALQGALNGH